MAAAWRDEPPNRSDLSSNATENYSIEEVSVSLLHHSSMPAVEKAYSTVASIVDQNSENSSRASDSVVDLGKALNADVFNEFAENETLSANIGETRDADSLLTDYANETPVNLGELMYADNPSYSINDAPSEYQNIGPDKIVGEESDWRYVEPVNIGATMDADNYQRN